MNKLIHVCILASDPSRPVAATSAKVGKEMFRGSVHGPDVRFEKEVGLGYWSVWKDDNLVGWINLVRIVDEEFIKRTS
jgi:hypothetical protein